MTISIHPIPIISLAVTCGAIIGAALYMPPFAVTPYATIANPLCSTTTSAHVEARAAYVYDLSNSRVLFEKNANAQLPLASLTKLMTVLVASQALKPGETVVITKEALNEEGDSGLVDGEMWRTDELIDFTLMTSSNDGARALALQSYANTPDTPLRFVDRMNAAADTLHMTQSYFLNQTGLDISSTTAGAYGSARDMASFAAHLHRKVSDVFDGSTEHTRVFTSLSGITHNASHTSELALMVQGGMLFKTGFTDLAQGNFIAVAEPLLGKPVALIVLGSPLHERERDVIQLYTLAKEVLKHDTLCAAFEKY